MLPNLNEPEQFPPEKDEETNFWDFWYSVIVYGLVLFCMISLSVDAVYQLIAD